MPKSSTPDPSERYGRLGGGGGSSRGHTRSTTEVANCSIHVEGSGGDIALAYEQVSEVPKGRSESFLERIRTVTPDNPVLFTLKLGSGPINGRDAADYATGLTQFPRFRFVA